jgi:hypothetical protein
VRQQVVPARRPLAEGAASDSLNRAPSISMIMTAIEATTKVSVRNIWIKKLR